MKLYQMTYPETGINYRLIYIDIERKIDGHLFMFGLDRGNGYERFIVDKNLQLAAERYGAVNIDEADILKEIFREKDSVMIVGYTTAELEWINSLACRFGFSIPECTMYMDAKKGAQKWAATERRGELRKLPRLSVTHHRFNQPSIRSLVSVVRLIGINPPSDYGYAITSGRFEYAARRLGSRGSFDSLTRVTKAKLTKAMKHNQFDVESMVELVALVFQQKRSALFKAIQSPSA